MARRIHVCRRQAVPPQWTRWNIRLIRLIRLFGRLRTASRHERGRRVRPWDGVRLLNLQREAEPKGPEFTNRAKYDGQCPECDLPIAVGQECVKTTRER